MKRVFFGLAVVMSACSTTTQPPQPLASSGLSPPSVVSADFQSPYEPKPGEQYPLKSFCRRISSAEAATLRPMLVRLSPISSGALLTAPGREGSGAWSLGGLSYAGQGVEVASDDSRFSELSIAPGKILPRRPNGDFIQVDIYTPYGAVTGSADCYAPWNPQDIPVNADAAPPFPAEMGVRLRAMDGLRLVGAAPLGPQVWLALMEPEGGSAETVLVRVSTDEAAAPTPVARLPFSFQAIQPVLDPHSARRQVRLIGRNADGGPFRVLVLDVSPSLL